MPIEIQFYTNNNRDPKYTEEPHNDWTVVADTEHNRPLVAYSKSYPGTEFPERQTEEEVGEEPEALMNIYKAVRTATRGVRESRKQFRYGPVNNAMFPYDANGKIDESVAPSYVCEPIQPYFLYTNGNLLESRISKFAPPFVDLLARFYRGVKTGAGVCSTLSAVGAGLMSMYSMPNSVRPEDQEVTLDNFLADEDPTTYLSIVTVSHGLNHSFNIVSYRNSPWYVSDPWPAEAYVLPISDGLFDLGDINGWAELRVYASLEDPFGLPLMSAWENEHSEDKNKVAGLSLQPKVLRQAWADYTDGLEVLSEYRKAGPGGADDYMPWVIEDGVWTPVERAGRIRGLSEKLFLQFHAPPSAYTQVTNVTDEAKPRYTPVAVGSEWGDNAQESGTRSPASAYKAERPAGPPPAE